VNGENFQKTVLEGLRDLKEGQSRLEGDVASLKEGQSRLEGDVASLKEGQARLEDKLNDLEARNAARHLQMESKLNLLIEDKKSIFEILGEHEAEIRTLKRKLG